MEEKELQVKMMFYIMLKGLDEVAKVDEEMQEDLEDIEGVIQWKVGNIRAYQVIKDGKYSFEIDAEHDDPDMTMIMEDIEVGRQMLSGELDGTSAYMSGDLKIEGDLQLAMSYGSLAEYLQDYLEPIRPT